MRVLRQPVAVGAPVFRMATLTDPTLQATAPTPHALRWLGRRSLVAVLGWAAGLALLAAWLTVGTLLTLRWREAIDDEQRHSGNLAAILQEQTVRVLAASDQAMIRLRDAVRDGAFKPEDTVQLANETGLAPKILLQLSLIGPDGHFQGSNLDPDGSKSGPVDLSERGHVRVHLRPAGMVDAPPLSANGLLIGKPVLGKVSKKWTIQLSRRIAAADGRVLGVVVASLDAGDFEDLYRGVQLGQHGGVSLIGVDEVVRARVVGGAAQGIGTSTRVAGQPSQLQGPRGHFESFSHVDGENRLVAFERVGDYPLSVAVLRQTDEAMARWRGARTMALSLAALFTLAVLRGSVLLGLGVRQLEASNAALRASEARAHASYQAKTEFLAAISHELRTPLTSIRGVAELMERRLPELVSTDELRLKQSLNNLLSNKLKFTTEGSMTLLLGPQDGRLLITVADTGPGIPAHLHETVFERFRQADASVSSQHGGTGLGLALSRGLAELMGGTLTLESRPGEGARFTLALPLA